MSGQHRPRASVRPDLRRPLPSDLAERENHLERDGEQGVPLESPEPVQTENKPDELAGLDSESLGDHERDQKEIRQQNPPEPGRERSEPAHGKERRHDRDDEHDGTHEEDDRRDRVDERVETLPERPPGRERGAHHLDEDLQGAAPPPPTLTDEVPSLVRRLNPNVALEHADPMTGASDSDRVLQILREAGFVPGAEPVQYAPPDDHPRPAEVHEQPEPLLRDLETLEPEARPVVIEAGDEGPVRVESPRK